MQACVGAQDSHTHRFASQAGPGGPLSVSPPSCCPPRIVCAIQAAEVPFTGGVEVDVNGKLGHSPPHVQFTYQVSA